MLNLHLLTQIPTTIYHVFLVTCGIGTHCNKSNSSPNSTSSLAPLAPLAPVTILYLVFAYQLDLSIFLVYQTIRTLFS